MSTVNVLLHGNDRLAGAIEQRLTKAGCRVVKLDLAGVDSIEVSTDLLRGHPHANAGRLAGLHPRRGTKIWMLVTLESWLRSVAARG